MADACTSCGKSPPEVSLKRCAKCSTTPYCSRDCQKEDWKAHKKACGAPAPPPGTTFISEELAASQLSPPKGVEQGVPMPFTRLDNGTWLHDRPERDVYGLLIDAYRLQMEDMYNLEGEADSDSIYGGASSGLRGFRRYLDRVETLRGLLPSWWDAAKRRECERLGMRPSQWHDLRCAVEKADIIDHYGDQCFPMQLRMFTEAAYGWTPGATDGTPMRHMMMTLEQGKAGGMQAMMTDWSRAAGQA